MRVPFIEELVNSVHYCPFLEELSGSVNVQEKSIIKALDSAGVTRPHVQIEFVKISSLLGLVESGKATDLLVILLVQTVLDHFSNEVEDMRELLSIPET